MGEGLGMKQRTLGILALAGVVLAACSGGDEVPSLQLQIIESTRDVIVQKRAPNVDRPPLTRAALAPIQETYIEVTLERNNQLAYLRTQTTLRDDRPGRITIWRSDDNVTLSMRNGVLIATRGLGGGIISSTVQVSATAPGPSRGGEKVHYVRTGDNRERRVALACDVTDLGAETIEIVELAYATRRLRERCRGQNGTVVNDYWIDSRAGVVRQSRQWAGPGIGYLRIRQLTN
jgi:Group 4 capsule polysaccharide lipoprotein gfcB, YjbF